jgi:hypothetical protein
MLTVALSEKFEGVIWRMETDALTDSVFIESRSAEDRRVTFSAFDLRHNSVLYKNLTIDEKWLTGIEAAFNGVLLLHGYQNENSPVHKGLTAIDFAGNILWSNYNYGFDHLSTSGPVVYSLQIQPKKLFIIDVHSGERISAFSGFEAEFNTQINYPDLALDLSDLSLPVSPALNSGYYLKHNNFIIVSLHAESNPGYNQHLYVLKNGVVVFEDILNSNIQKLQPEAFILFKNYLVYVKNKSELKVLNLQPAE